MNLFDEKTLRKLEQLTLVAERVRVGVMKGDRRSTRRGSSIEFADFRNYVQGDDLRRLDWNIYARLERPFIKLLEEEEDLAVHVLVDASASMDWPPEGGRLNKLNYGRRLAGALGHISLNTGDLVTVTLLQSQRDRSWGPFRGQAQALSLFQFLESVNADGITDLNLSLQSYAQFGRRPGLLLLISDFLSPGGYREGINALQSKGYELGLIHLLSPDEADPDLSGDLKLVDVETGADAEITLDQPTLNQYRERLAAWQSEMAGYCARRFIHYVPVITQLPWDRLVIQTLGEKGIVK